jgi:hypothetical protein
VYLKIIASEQIENFTEYSVPIGYSQELSLVPEIWRFDDQMRGHHSNPHWLLYMCRGDNFVRPSDTREGLVFPAYFLSREIYV